MTAWVENLDKLLNENLDKFKKPFNNSATVSAS